MKREITVDGKASDWFEKATFVLKENHDKAIPKDLFPYAEELVERYMKCSPVLKENRGQIPRLQTEKEKEMVYVQNLYKLQNNYDHLKKRERQLARRAKQIDLFFCFAVGLCLLSVAVLGVITLFH